MNKRGFTLVELAIVIGILGIILTIVGGFIGSATARVGLTDVSTQMVDALRRAQWQTINGQDDTDWGVHIETDAFILFKGEIYNFAEPDNFVTLVDDPLYISDVSLNGGSNDVIFDAQFGDSTTYGVITITNSVTEEFVVVKINAVGSIDAD